MNACTKAAPLDRATERKMFNLFHTEGWDTVQIGKMVKLDEATVYNAIGYMTAAGRYRHNKPKPEPAHEPVTSTPFADLAKPVSASRRNSGGGKHA